MVPPGTYRAFAPKVGEHLVVSLPGETMRVPVTRIVTSDAVLVKIDTTPMAKSHNFRLDDIVGVRRRIRDGRDVWEAQNDRDFLAEQATLVPPVAEKPKVVAKKKAKR